MFAFAPPVRLTPPPRPYAPARCTAPRRAPAKFAPALRHRPSRRAGPRASAAGNGTVPGGSAGSPSDEDRANGDGGASGAPSEQGVQDWTIEREPHYLRAPGDAPTSDELHRALVKALSDPSQRPDGRGARGEAIQLVIGRLEALNAAPQTAAFAELALSGEWRLLFSSFRTQLRAHIRLRSLTQRFDPAAATMVNSVRWSFPDRSGDGEVDAVLDVKCAYKFAQTPGRLEIELQGHTMRIEPRADGKDHDMPENMRAVIADLQLTLPFEHFDPSGTVDISYVDPRFRIARFVGKRLAGVRNIFEKVE